MTTRAQRAARRGGNKAGGSKKAAAAASVAAAAAAPEAPAASFADLPDELAVRIFSHLDLHTRQAALGGALLSEHCPGGGAAFRALPCWVCLP